MELSHSFPSVTFAVLTVDQSVEHSVDNRIRIATILEETTHQAQPTIP